MRKVLGLAPDETLMRVKSWVPLIDRDGIWWPTMVVLRRGEAASTVIPLRIPF